MAELQVVNLEGTEITRWDFALLKSELEQKLELYKTLVYTDDNIKSAKNDRTTLNKAKKVIEDCRKAYKAQCLAPYEALEPQVKELVAMIEEQRLLIDETVKEYENRQKQEKEIAVKAYYDKKAAQLGEHADVLYTKLLDQKWLNASTTKAKYEEGIQTAINQAAEDLKTIKDMNSPFVDTLIEKYVETLSLDAVKEKESELTETMKKANLTAQEEVKTEVKTASGEAVTVKIYATQNQLNQIFDFMKAIGVTYEL